MSGPFGHEHDDWADGDCSRCQTELRRNPDPITGEPRPTPVGECPVCHTLVFESDDPVPVVMIDGRNPFPWSKPDIRHIHGKVDCTDRAPCPETRSGTTSSGEWGVHCGLLADHDGECYWADQ